MRATLAAAVVLLLMTPVAILATFLLLPLRRAFEDLTDVPTVGHASPSHWRFVATWLVLAPVAARAAYRAARARPTPVAQAG